MHIFKKQTIELKPVSVDATLQSAAKMMKRHRKSVDDLK